MQWLQRDLSSLIQHNEGKRTKRLLSWGWSGPTLHGFPGSMEPCAETSALHEDFGVTGAGVDPHQQPTESENNKIASCIRVVLFIRFGEMMRCGQLYGVLLQDAALWGFTLTLLTLVMLLL